MDGIRGRLNSTLSGSEDIARRIAGEAEKEYVFNRGVKPDLKPQIDRFDQSKGLSERLLSHQVISRICCSLSRLSGCNSS